MKNKKDLLGGIIIISLLLLVLITYLSFYNYKKEELKINEENKLKDNSLSFINIYDDYTTLKIEDKNKIENNKVVIGSYNCKEDNCAVYENNHFKSIYDDKYIILKERDEIFIYDFSLNKVVSNYYQEIEYLLNDLYFIVKNDNKYGIITKFGVEIIENMYDEISYNEVYENYIKVGNNKLYGIIDLDNGNTIIDTKYKDINITDSKYYSVLKDNLWYIIDKDENIITNGYEYVFPFSKGFIALKDNNLYILKYNIEEEKPLNDNIINVSGKDSFSINRKGSIISIEVNNEANILKYEYSINRNNLTNK